MQHVPPIFFLEAEHNHELRFWRHESLKLLEEYGTDSTEIVAGTTKGADENDIGDEHNEDEDDEEEEDDEDEDITYQHGGHTFEEALTEDIDLIVEFVKGLKYQLQF